MGRGMREYKYHKNVVRVYLVLLLFTGVLISHLLNGLSLQIAVKQLKATGIDYESFRTLSVSEKQIGYLQKKLKKTKKEVTYNPIHYFTMEMMLNKFDLLHNKRNSKRNLEYLLQRFEEDENYLELYGYYTEIFLDLKNFPTTEVTFDNSWNGHRSYGGNRRHEGTDLMPPENVRGVYPIFSMTDGVVEKLGWLEQGGYRVGIRGKEGGYFYYAHLESYSDDVKEGKEVKAGDILGMMGDTGYGVEGTRGKFDVHLHFGIYVEAPYGELSVNPYWVLKYLEGQN